MASFASLDALCDSILVISENIQSVSAISKMGRLVGSTSRPEFAGRFKDAMDENLFMQCVLQISMGRDFDDDYGPINYHISDRGGITMLTFPMGENVLLVSCNKNVSPITLAKKVANAIRAYHGQASAIEL